ncbi:unnamed protein product [Psylliodes chrysocephalus]|uniref:Uncharacterized protein n=1 Tax=Psylliodes chrysocephalus TaxID=3402493 RepID=A0A9P0CSM3_9CUCU|nr:unnamed protein product [Psylliodes chrysocephala]
MNKLVLFLLLTTIFQHAENAQKVEEYDIPANTKYPYGDEMQFNFNTLDKNANPFPCEEYTSLEKRLGRCPIDAEKLPVIDNPYTECPDYAVVPIPIDSDSLPNPKPNPDVLCRRCDLKLTADGVGVLLECNYCLDVPSPLRVADSTVKDIQYKVFFVQIANYTSVEVTGSEYFNP